MLITIIFKTALIPFSFVSISLAIFSVFTTINDRKEQKQMQIKTEQLNSLLLQQNKRVDSLALRMNTFRKDTSAQHK